MGKGKYWGFAQFHNVDAPPPEFEGTFWDASEEVLNAVIDGRPYHPMPKDDLESFVKTVAAVNSGGRRLWRELSALEQGGFLGARDTRVKEKLHYFMILSNQCGRGAALMDYIDLADLRYGASPTPTSVATGIFWPHTTW